MERKKRNRGEFERRKQVVGIVIRDGETKVYAIARELDSSVRQIRLDLQYIKDEYNIETRAGRYGGVFWMGNKFGEFEEHRRRVQENLSRMLSSADATAFICIIQELCYSSQEKAYEILIRLIDHCAN